MDVFQAKLRGFHARAVENIMLRTSCFNKPESRDKVIKSKGDNITTYLRKFQIDRENLNLAKRILLCESQHNHKFYQREWKKTENFLRVRSNFKRGLSNEEPRLFKFEPIHGKGNCLVTISFLHFQSSPVYFRAQNLYSINALIKHNSVAPTNNTFTLNTLGNSTMSFYMPSQWKNKKINCKISEIKENEEYHKGKFQINLALSDDQEVDIINKQGKAIAKLIIRVDKQHKSKKQNSDKNATSLHHSDQDDKENGEFDDESQKQTQ